MMNKNLSLVYLIQFILSFILSINVKQIKADLSEQCRKGELPCVGLRRNTQSDSITASQGYLGSQSTSYAQLVSLQPDAVVNFLCYDSKQGIQHSHKVTFTNGAATLEDNPTGSHLDWNWYPVGSPKPLTHAANAYLMITCK